MTEKKEVALTLKNVLDHPFMKEIMDVTKDVSDETINNIIKFWTFDMYSRKPGPALIDGIFQGTDLDLVCFLSALAERNAVINIPKYKSMRPETIKEGQRVISDDNRHGPVLNLTANKDLFSFGIRIKDYNVIGTESVGEYRTFSITDPSGDWYSGWQSIEWNPSLKENKFLSENQLWTQNKVIFSNFVHPNRWTSFYGHHYFITKALIQRFTEQSENYREQIKRMINNGITYPTTGDGAQTVWPEQKREEGKSVKFKSLEVEVDFPYNEPKKYPVLKDSQENLIKLTKEQRYWTYTLIPNLRFSTRATELAYFKHNNPDQMPHWLKNVVWEKGYKQKGKRIEWDRLKLIQPGVGQLSVAIRKRVKEKSEIMAKDYKGGI